LLEDFTGSYEDENLEEDDEEEEEEEEEEGEGVTCTGEELLRLVVETLFTNSIVPSSRTMLRGDADSCWRAPAAPADDFVLAPSLAEKCAAAETNPCFFESSSHRSIVSLSLGTRLTSCSVVPSRE